MNYDKQLVVFEYNDVEENLVLLFDSISYVEVNEADNESWLARMEFVLLTLDLVGGSDDDMEKCNDDRLISVAKMGNEELIFEWMLDKLERFRKFVGMSYEGFEDEICNLFQMIENNYNKKKGKWERSDFS